MSGGVGGYRCIVDGNNIEVDGVGDRAALTVINEVVKACNAVEVFVRREGIGVGDCVVIEFAIGHREVDDREVVAVGARGHLTIGVIEDVWVCDTCEEISRGEGVGGVLGSIGDGDFRCGKNRCVVEPKDVEIEGLANGVFACA